MHFPRSDLVTDRVTAPAPSAPEDAEVLCAHRRVLSFTSMAQSCKTNRCRILKERRSSQIRPRDRPRDCPVSSGGRGGVVRTQEGVVVPHGEPPVNLSTVTFQFPRQAKPGTPVTPCSDYLRPVVCSSPKGCTSCIVKPLMSRSFVIASPLWTP